MFLVHKLCSCVYYIFGKLCFRICGFTQRRKVFASETWCIILFFMKMEIVLVNAASITKVDCQWNSLITMCEAVCNDIFTWIRTSPRSEANILIFFEYVGWEVILVGNTSSWKTKLNTEWRNITAQTFVGTFQNSEWALLLRRLICKEEMVIIVKPHT